MCDILPFSDVSNTVMRLWQKLCTTVVVMGKIKRSLCMNHTVEMRKYLTRFVVTEGSAVSPRLLVVEVAV